MIIDNDKSETSDDICKRAYNEKSAEFYTWTQLMIDKIIWRYFFILAGLHVGFIVALSTYVFGLHSVPVKTWTILWVFIVGQITFFGTTAGAHRLWTHRAYKAKLPLRILLMILFTMMGELIHVEVLDSCIRQQNGSIRYALATMNMFSQTPLYYWIRDHRVHHKYSETDADPHNATRGFVFAHAGWLVMKRHPECLRRGKEIDMSDIVADPVVMFQKKYALSSRLLLCFVIPTVVPIIFWKETILHAVLTQCFIRYVLFLNFVLSVNSVTHLWGSRPYNRLINPVENLIVSLIACGEGSHNYHHTFPWDYKTSELPYVNFNSTTLFIDAMAKLGLAYDLRETSRELVEKVVRRIGYKSKLKES